jgi:RNA polymerase sigma-70 factor (ECF subfamily)
MSTAITAMSGSVREVERQAAVRWPGVRCSSASFAEHVLALGISSPQLSAFGEDLFLAFACAEQDKVALQVFDAQYLSRVGRAIMRIDAASDFLDEVTQRLRERLLAPPTPRIRGYAATGPLLSWTRVSAVRVALNLKQHESKHSHRALADCLLQEFDVTPSETNRYREVLEDSLRKVFRQLEARERNLIRLHYIDGLNVDRLGAMYSVHRATAARWIVAARDRIFEDVARDVRATLKLSPSEFQSVLGLVRSYVDANLSGLFGPAELSA